MAYILDTRDIAPEDRAEAVYAAMLYASVPCYVIHERPHDPIRSRMEVWDLGDTNIFTKRSTGVRLLRTARQARQDAAPVIALAVQEVSEGRHEQLDHRQLLAPGDLLVVDLSAPYDYSWSGDGGAGCVQIPVEQLGLPMDVIRRAAGNVRASPLYDLVRGHVAQLARDPAGHSTDPAAASVAAAGVELARALLASAAQTGRHARTALAETLLTRVRAHVRQHLTDPGLSPASIAAAHNVSLRYLYRICEKAGFSLEQWIIGERLRGAAEELRRPDSRGRTVAMVARRWGFTDPTHFTRRFRAAHGVTPAEWRRTGTGR